MKESNYGEIAINSTKIQIEEFKDSLIWKDMVNELDVWKKGFDIERANIVDDAATDNPSTASVLLHLGDINGRIKTVEFVKNLPDIFLEIIAIRTEEEKLNENTNGG